MEKGSKKKNNVVERTLPIQNENYHGYIASSDYYKCKPSEWKYLQGGVNMRYLLANEYQRMWMDEQQEWYDRIHRPKKESVNIVKKYVTEFKDKVHPNVPRIDTKLCRMKKSEELQVKAKSDSKRKTRDSQTNYYNKQKTESKRSESNESGYRCEKISKKVLKQNKPCDTNETTDCRHQTESSNDSVKVTPRSNRSEVEKEKADSVPHTNRSMVSENGKDLQECCEGNSSESTATICKTNDSVREKCLEEKHSNIVNSARSTTLSARTIKSSCSAINKSKCSLVDECQNEDCEGNHTDRSVLSKRNGLTEDIWFYKEIR